MTGLLLTYLGLWLDMALTGSAPWFHITAESFCITFVLILVEIERIFLLPSGENNLHNYLSCLLLLMLPPHRRVIVFMLFSLRYFLLLLKIKLTLFWMCLVAKIFVSCVRGSNCDIGCVTGLFNQMKLDFDNIPRHPKASNRISVRYSTVICNVYMLDCGVQSVNMDFFKQKRCFVTIGPAGLTSDRHW